MGERYTTGKAAPEMVHEDGSYFCNAIDADAAARIAAALNAQAGVVKALRDMEWMPSESPDGDRACPLCARYEQYGHADDCKLATALAALKERGNA